MRKLNDKLLKWYIAVKECERGATAVEYGLIVALIAAVIIIAVVALGENIKVIFQGVADKIGDITPGG